MENLDLKQMSSMVDIIAEEKGLPRDVVLNVIEMAIAAAWRKDNGDKDMNVRATLNTKTGEADVYVAREVIESGLAYNPSTEIPQDKAGAGAQIGDIVEEKIKVTTFGRVAAMTAKQVVIQRLREAENDAVLSEYEDKVGTVVTGMVSRVEPKMVRIDLGRANGIMPRSEQIDGEYYTVGSRIKVYIKKIERNDRGAQLVLSRGSAEFVEYLFRQEVPEIENGTVQIKGIAREAGRRTKIAVISTVSGVDPVGTFVGGRGVRVQAVMNEIGDKEKIDIINWSDNPSEYIREALSPAEINRVEIDGDKATVYVTEEQQSIAIGKQGQNVRLASRLTGYTIDIALVKASTKKKKKNVEDSLIGALSEMEDETAEADKESEAAVNTENVAAVENAENTETAEKSEE
ncbi:transcription termination factor NusA [Candidatus Saccharibacteria bacterium]|nr:transcription termination factor NusA [Candidatus Saccharibacteria bacterium]